MQFYLQDDMLVKVDRASMAHSLEVRVPYLDHNVVEFMGRVPANLKYRGRTSKYLLKLIWRNPSGVIACGLLAADLFGHKPSPIFK